MLAIWFAVVGASVIWTVADVWAAPNRAMPIMNWVWPLVALYFGPLGAVLYVRLSGRAHGAAARPLLPTSAGDRHKHTSRTGPMPGMGDPLWMRAARSATHCMAGCALGDLVAMVLVEAGGWLPLGSILASETVVGAILAFLFGLLVFQSFPVMAERKIGFRAALGLALQADAATIAAYLIGQIPALYLLHRFVGTGPTFAVGAILMQGAMAVGFAATYPANYWLVARGVKHGM